MSENLENFFAKIRNRQAKDIPLRKVPIIELSTSCKNLFSCFFDVDVAAVIVNDKDGNYIGLLTPKEFLSLFTPRHTDIQDVISKARLFSSTTAEDLVNTHLPKVCDDYSIKHVAELMSKYETVVLPRVETRKGEVMGVITLRDIIGFVRNEWRKFLEEEEEEISCESDA
ncbi:MAG: CBS domain-containing protein [Candidatus Heimdallarchaeaceae archaeon]